MLAGHLNGHKTSLSSMFEAVGAYAAGKLDEDGLTECEMKTCPTCGSCSGMYTANSMNCLTEVLGMGLKGNGTIPAVYSERIRLAKHAGMQVMEMYRKNIRPRDIMTKEAILNALTVDMALGCSTNSMLHLPAIAHEIGMDFDISFANEISAKTPNLCHLAPAGPSWTIISSTTAERFTTPPSGARLPLRTASPPVWLYGLSIGLITSGFKFTQSLMFSPTVLP